MPKFFTFLFAFYFFASSFFLVSINTVICLLVAPFDPLRRAVHMFASGWGQHYFSLNPRWKLNFHGVEHIKRGKTYVLVANHQSLFDILILYGLYRTYKW